MFLRVKQKFQGRWLFFNGRRTEAQGFSKGLSRRYVHHRLSLFNKVSYTGNARGPPSSVSPKLGFYSRRIVDFDLLASSNLSSRLVSRHRQTATVSGGFKRVQSVRPKRDQKGTTTGYRMPDSSATFSLRLPNSQSRISNQVTAATLHRVALQPEFMVRFCKLGLMSKKT